MGAMGVWFVTSIPPMMLALIAGIAASRLSKQVVLMPGLNFAARPFLFVAVALLGLSVDVGAILGGGPFLPLLSIGALVLTLIFGLILCKLLGINREFSVLISGAVAICGVSAAAALCCALPACQNRQKELAVTVTGITILSAAAMLLYPIISPLAGLTDEQAGAFFGATIHNVSQVVGAGLSISPEAGEVGTFVKLIRVSAMLPVILIVSFAFGASKGATKNNWQVYFPPFLIAFFSLALIGSFNIIPEAIVSPLSFLSKLLLFMSLVAIGMKTRIADILTVGPKPLIAMAMTTVFMAAIALWALMLM